MLSIYIHYWLTTHRSGPVKETQPKRVPAAFHIARCHLTPQGISRVESDGMGRYKSPKNGYYVATIGDNSQQEYITMVNDWWLWFIMFSLIIGDRQQECLRTARGYRLSHNPSKSTVPYAFDVLQYGGFGPQPNAAETAKNIKKSAAPQQALHGWAPHQDFWGHFSGAHFGFGLRCTIPDRVGFANCLDCSRGVSSILPPVRNRLTHVEEHISFRQTELLLVGQILPGWSMLLFVSNQLKCANCLAVIVRIIIQSQHLLVQLAIFSSCIDCQHP